MAALRIAGLAADGSPVEGEVTGEQRYEGRACTEGCVAIELGIDTNSRILGLPVPTGHLVDPNSVRLDGVAMPVVEMATGQPAVQLETPRAGRLRYRTGPGTVAERGVGTGWPELPAEPQEQEESVDKKEHV